MMSMSVNTHTHTRMKGIDVDIGLHVHSNHAFLVHFPCVGVHHVQCIHYSCT